MPNTTPTTSPAMQSAFNVDEAFQLGEKSAQVSDDPEEAVSSDAPKQMLSQWYQVSEQLKKLKPHELLLRNKCFKLFFTDPKEGTNNHDLEDGFVLKADHKLNRSLDKAVLTTMTDKLREAGIVVEDVVDWKPELKKSAYNRLTEKQKLLMDECIVMKEGTPALSIVQPKRKPK